MLRGNIVWDENSPSGYSLGGYDHWWLILRERSPTVPDSGETISLLGCAFFALAVFRRKFVS
jgi:hypothetical protein